MFILVYIWQFLFAHTFANKNMDEGIKILVRVVLIIIAVVYVLFGLIF